MSRVRMLVGVGLLMAVGMIAWAQSRVIRIRPGPVKLVTVNLLGAEIFNRAALDCEGKFDDLLEVTEGEHEVCAVTYEAPDGPIGKVRRRVRASGPRTDVPQEVTVRVWTWDLDWLRARRAAPPRDNPREVVVNVRWSDGGIATGAYVSCEGASMLEVNGDGFASCGSLLGPVSVMAWRDWHSPIAVRVLPADDSELELSLEPAIVPDGG